MSLFQLSPLLIERLGWTLLHSLWQFTLIALLAGMAVRLLVRNSSATRHAILGMALVATVIAPAITWTLLPVTLPEYPTKPSEFTLKPALQTEQATNSSGSPGADNSPMEIRPALPPRAIDAAPALEISDATRSVDPPLGTPQTRPAENLPSESPWSDRLTMILRPWLSWIVAGWCVGVLLCAMRPLLGWHMLWRLRRVGVSPVSDEVRAALKRVSEQLRIRRAVRILHSTLAKVPVVVGYVRPIILLPLSLATTIPAAQLESILAHELAHVRRHDFLINLLQTLVETVFFYHPAIWWLSNRLRAERENCCDDLVIAALGNRVEYGRALLAVEELRGRNSVLAIGAADGSLLSRIRRIAGLQSHTKTSSPWPTLSLIVCGIVAAFAITALSLASLAHFPDHASAQPPDPNPTPLSKDLNGALIGGSTPIRSGEWPMWGGSSHRNHVASGRMPTDWDLKTGQNVLWTARLGTQTYSSPIVSGGKVFIGTNNGAGLDPRRPKEQDFSCLVCRDQSTGKLLWQYASEKLPEGRVHDWPAIGLCATACVDGDRLWVVTNRCEVVCLDADGFRDGENDGDFTAEKDRTERDADIVWKYDMFNSLVVRPLHQAVSSIAIVEGLVLLNTSNGPDESRSNGPVPHAANFLALDARTGRVVWQDNSAGESIIVGGSSCSCSGTSPAVARIGGVTQAIFAGREGWLYGFDFADILQGKTTRLWQFDCNPKTSTYFKGSQSTRNTLVASPVVVGNHVFIATGRNPEEGEGVGDLWCIDAAKRGDISSELVFNNAHEGGRKPIPHKPQCACDPKQGDFTRPNPNSGAVWHYTGTDRDGDGKLAFDEAFHRSISSPAIHDGLLFIPDFSGLLHCVDAHTGEGLWAEDLFAAVWSSCVIADGKVLVGDEDGDLAIFRAARTRQRIHGGEFPNFGTSLYCTPAIVKNTLFVATKDMLVAIRDTPESPIGQFSARETGESKAEAAAQDNPANRIDSNAARGEDERTIREPAKAAVPKELEPFQGTWAMDLCDSETKDFGDLQPVVKHWRWSITGNEILWSRSRGEVWKLKLAVDPQKSPKEIDLTFIDGPHKGETCLGMYEWGGINKKMLQISVQDPGAKVARPTSISMRGGGQTSLIFLEPMDAEKELASLQGTWRFEIIQTDGWPKPTGKGPDQFGRGDDRQWVIKGNEITWTSPIGEEVKLSFTIDPSKSPKHIDVTFLSGPHKGQTCQGMYERGGVGGVVLWLCLVDPGSQAPRPMKVSYATHEGRTMIGLIRVDPPEEKPGAKADGAAADAKAAPAKVEAATVVGTVTTPDGQPVAGIEVLAFQGGKQLAQKFKTDERGEFRVPKEWREAEQWLTVVARDGRERLGWFDFMVHGHSDTGQKSKEGSFRLVLLPMSRTIRGRLLDESGQPLAQIPVRIHQLNHDVNLFSVHWRYQKLNDEPLILGAVTDNDGKFELKLPTDTFAWLGTAHPDWVVQQIRVTKEKDEVGDTKLVRAAQVAGRVIDSRTGKPVVDVRIGARAAKTELFESSGDDAQTDAKGEYVIQGLRSGEFTIQVLEGAEKTLTAPAIPSVPLKSNETFRADFALIVGKRLAGRVLDMDTGEPIPNCKVTYTGPARPLSDGLSTETNTQGEFEFFVPPGESRLDATEGRRFGAESTRDINVPADRDPEPVVLKVGEKSEIVPGSFKIFLGPPLDRKVSLSFQRAPLAEVLEHICQSAGVKLELDADGLKREGYTKNMPVSINAENITLQDALTQVLKPFDKLSFLLEKNQVFVSTRSEVEARENAKGQAGKPRVNDE